MFPPIGATGPKKHALSAASTTYDRKLITVWKGVAARAEKHRSGSLTKLIGQPGCWDALVGALDAGKVPVAALWRFDEEVMDHLPARFAADVLRALPPDITSLWHAYRLSAKVVLAQVLADPGALDGLAAEGSEIVRDLIEIARIVANVAPRESASSRIRESIAREWSVGAAIHPVAVVDALIGREAIVRVLAAGPHMGPRFD